MDSRLFNKRIDDTYQYKANDFKKAIRDSHALVAGGGVLGAYSSTPFMNDFDIYVHPNHAKTLISGISKMGYGVTKRILLTSAYDESFFRKNNILSKITLLKDFITYKDLPNCFHFMNKWWLGKLSKGKSPKTLFESYDKNREEILTQFKLLKKYMYENGLPNEFHMNECFRNFIRINKYDIESKRPQFKKHTPNIMSDFRNTSLIKYVPIDIMIINPKYSLKSVVTNFDLTFCQIWYDGHTVEASHMDDIKNMNGSLNPDYHQLFSQHNPFTLKRINKYQQRGFTINIEPCELTPYRPYKKDIDYPIEWVAKKIYEYVINKTDKSILEKIDILSLHPLIDNFEEIHLLHDKHKDNGDKCYCFYYMYNEIITNLPKTFFIKVFSVFKTTQEPYLSYIKTFLNVTQEDIIEYKEQLRLTFLRKLEKDDLDEKESYKKESVEKEPEIPLIPEDVSIKHPSISLLINSHGGDTGWLNPDLQTELYDRVQIAYKITHNSLNFSANDNFSLLEEEYHPILPVSEQLSNSEIMIKYIDTCKESPNKQTLEFINSSYSKYTENKPSAISMVEKNRQCYIGRPIVNRTFYFNDPKWFDYSMRTNSLLKVNTPIMGNIYVLRASYTDGTYARGDLLQKQLLSNRLQALQIIVKNLVISTSDYSISFEELLPLLSERFERIYIYDFGCRVRSKTGFTKLPHLNRQLSNTIYQKEVYPHLERLPTLPLGEKKQVLYSDISQGKRHKKRVSRRKPKIPKYTTYQ